MGGREGGVGNGEGREGGEEGVGLGTWKGGGVYSFMHVEGGGGQTRVTTNTQVPSSREPITLQSLSKLLGSCATAVRPSTNPYGYHPPCHTHRAHGTAATLSRVLLPSKSACSYCPSSFTYMLPSSSRKPHRLFPILLHSAASCCIKPSPYSRLLLLIAHLTCLLHNCTHVRAHCFNAQCTS